MVVLPAEAGALLAPSGVRAEVIGTNIDVDFERIKSVKVSDLACSVDPVKEILDLTKDSIKRAT